MDRYECSICGYIYEEANGDADAGIAAGTKFADLPEDYHCSLCEAPKSNFINFLEKV